jgi:hypothetical protein
LTDEESENDGAEREMLERPHDFKWVCVIVLLDSILFAGWTINDANGVAVRVFYTFTISRSYPTRPTELATHLKI